LTLGLISFADCALLMHYQLKINLITSIWSWSIERWWIHHKIL